ncbi:unnamed protein product [Acanthoscelides obtectus]|uniref:40S ribosomal protein S25 n=1 Tax=Acanthoscelides obtectus TaxID=200917 RepID=A0A9P0KBU5_ACAOB|nr:unnamed protein product [Acanthoscelides obtectus]CAK1645581.1 40S ribosomal protein S25 [Acanthoscelides obtectus]
MPPKKDAKSSAKQPQKTQKKKEGSGGGKAKKKKWSKGKVRDKLNNQVLFDKATYDKLYKEVPSYKLITPSVVSERLKVRGSLARRALIELQQKGDSLSKLCNIEHRLFTLGPPRVMIQLRKISDTGTFMYRK